jgi:hypothetical protein
MPDIAYTTNFDDQALSYQVSDVAWIQTLRLAPALGKPKSPGPNETLVLFKAE